MRLHRQNTTECDTDLSFLWQCPNYCLLDKYRMVKKYSSKFGPLLHFVRIEVLGLIQVQKFSTAADCWLMVVRLPRVLFMASHATQLVVRIVEVFNSCLIAAHSQLKVRVCNFWKKKIHVFFLSESLSPHDNADFCHRPTIWCSQVDFWDQQKLNTVVCVWGP